MRIGVISDTHIPEILPVLPESVETAFAGVDAILHAGDLVSLPLLAELGRIAPVTAVFGNMDNISVKSALPRKTVFEANGVKIGLIHGNMPPEMEMRARMRYDRTGEMDFESNYSFLHGEFEDVNCVVFGHLHRRVLEYHKGILFFNPGAVCRLSPVDISSIGILTINEKVVSGEHIKISV